MRDYASLGIDDNSCHATADMVMRYALRRRLAFTFGHIPGIAKYYWKHVFGSAALVAVAAIVALLSDAGWSSTPAGKVVYLILQYGPLGILLALFIGAFFHAVLKRLFRGELVQEHVLLDAYYQPNNRYTLIERFRCVNESGIPIRELTGIKEGYHSQPKSVSAEAKLLSHAGGHQITLTGPTILPQTHIVDGNAVTVQKYEWNAVVNPPIRGGETFCYYVRFSAQGTEQDAFKAHGTVFSWRVFYPTRILSIMVHAPAGYKLMLLGHSVNNEEGNAVAKELRRAWSPRIIGDGVVLQWRILLPQMHLRYGLRYSVVSL